MYRHKTENLLDNEKLQNKIQKLRIDTVALASIIDLHALEQHIEEAIMLYELNGSLPGHIITHTKFNNLNQIPLILSN